MMNNTIDCRMIRNKNPGSCAKLKVDRPWPERNPIFQRMFVLFDAQAKGFVSNCRPIIGLDACFLKGPYGGQLMHVVGKDGNNQMYPIAMAAVELLTDVIRTPRDKGWIFISDRQKASVVVLFNLLSKF